MIFVDLDNTLNNLIFIVKSKTSPFKVGGSHYNFCEKIKIKGE